MILLLFLLFLLFIYILLSWYKYGFPFSITRTIFSIGFYEGKDPLNIKQSLRYPIIKASKFDNKQSLFVADPFFIKHEGFFYLFFESYPKTRKGVIGCMSSNDLINWENYGVVLEEKHHLSYPFIFSFENEIYMLPEASESNQLVLYKSDEFPKVWKPYKVLCNEFLIDASLLYFENVWYLFASKDNGSVSLFYSDHLTNKPFIEHQCSPIRTNDKIYSRSGGRPFIYEKKLYRIAQATVPNYGNKVTLINIVKLSKTEYFEEITDGYNTISASGIGWNSTGMHHVDVQAVGDKWLAAVDGHAPKRFWGIQINRLLFFNKYKLTRRV